MQISIQIKSPTMGVEALLKPEAMPALMKIIEEHQLTEVPEGMQLRMRGGRKHRRGPGHEGGEGQKAWIHDMPELPKELSAAAQAISDQIGTLTPKLLLEKAQPATFPEKFVVIIGWLESKRKRRPIRPEIRAAFARWPLEASGNPARDFKTAANMGWIAKLGREFGLTDAGWKKLGEMSAAN